MNIQWGYGDTKGWVHQYHEIIGVYVVGSFTIGHEGAVSAVRRGRKTLCYAVEGPMKPFPLGSLDFSYDTVWL